jgi:hypothetical protein
MALNHLINPTQIGDKVAIVGGGIIIYQNAYEYKMKELNKLFPEMILQDKKALAVEEALNRFGMWANDTQQTNIGTFKRYIQLNPVTKYLLPFLNYPMQISEKVLSAYSNLYRGYANAYNKAKAEGLSAGNTALNVLTNRTSLGAIKNIVLYQVLTQLIYQTMRSRGDNLTNLYSDDEKERETAWIDLFYDVGLGWTKGLFGVGFVLSYAKDILTGRVYGRQADNWISLFNDAMKFAEGINDIIKESKKVKEASTPTKIYESEEKLKKAKTTLAIRGSALVGYPAVAMERLRDVYNNPDLYPTEMDKFLRTTGVLRKRKAE